MADQGLMPKGLLNESIRSVENNSVINNALIMDPNFDLDASLHRLQTTTIKDLMTP